MPLIPGTIQAIENYVEIRGQAFHLAYQWLKQKQYTREECVHFATMTVSMMFADVAKADDVEKLLIAQMKAMTPGGQA